MLWFVYILFCDQKIYYVGLTHDVHTRIKQHKNKESRTTKKFSDISLLYTESFPTRTQAERREKQLKRWTVAKKKALIAGDLETLKVLSKSHEPVEGRKVKW